MREINIRTVSAADAEDICAICSEDLGYPCELSLVAQKIMRLDPEREAVFAAVSNNVVAGFIHVEKYDLLYFETMANILGLAVKAEYRRSGIGKQLIAAAEDWAVKNGIKAMRLNSGISRTGAHDFYRHLGYDDEKGQIRFNKSL